MSANNKYESIFSGSNAGNCLSKGMLLGYLAGNLSVENHRKVERHLVDCSFCSDALKGLALMPDKEKTAATLSDIEHDIDTITHEQSNVRRLIPSWYKIAVAASLILLIGISFFMTRQLIDDSDTTMAQKEVREEEAVDEVDLFKKTEQQPPIDREELNVPPAEHDDKESTTSGYAEQPEFASKKNIPELRQSNRQIDGAEENFKTGDDKQVEYKFDAMAAEEIAVQGQEATTGMAAPEPDMPMDEVVMESEGKSDRARSQAADKAAPEGMPAKQQAITQQSANVNTESVYDKAIAQLALGTKKGYREAVRLFNEVLQQDPGNLAAYYHLGVSHFHLNAFDEALPQLDIVIMDGTSELVANAVYYKSVILIERGQKKEAAILLERIKDLPSPQEPSAGKLLDELDE